MQRTEIRPESSRDVDKIRAITIDAFQEMPFSDGDEQDVIDRLRSAGALTLSFVAELEEQIVGHIAFSPARISDASNPWFALGPVSVSPAYQRLGIGSTMIERGIVELQSIGALGCILTGNPLYYRRFGFEVSPQLAPDNEPAEYFMLRLLSSVKPKGKFMFHEAFYDAA